jgi:hypothetical protein
MWITSVLRGGGPSSITGHDDSSVIYRDKRLLFMMYWNVVNEWSLSRNSQMLRGVAVRYKVILDGKGYWSQGSSCGS